MRIGMLGGSFNPVHTGHVRLAMEALELLHLDRIDFVPAAIPPHKPSAGLLPFGLRCRLLRLAVAGLSRMHVNLMEAHRRGPSYTWDTLGTYAEEQPGARLFFLMGASDLPTLPAWRHGLDLPRRADLVVAARLGMAAEQVQELISRYWPGAVGPQTHATPGKVPGKVPDKVPDKVLTWRLPENGRLMLIAPPCLEISSTLIREYWRQGRNLTLLTPKSVEQELMRKKSVVDRFWI
jgi:nicotinate-nucleotide adenylyltransferase